MYLPFVINISSVLKQIFAIYCRADLKKYLVSVTSGTHRIYMIFVFVGLYFHVRILDLIIIVETHMLVICT